ncbi:DNA mismatch repair protein MutS [Leptospira sp. GIMC2001]|uniref:DNA mismatch repair protein MutS n=1 Tax=Leptospira sp. GIMC2001 TaxID=1513297 RepID=UPI00234B494C|nr:DNA mismatch repair protein MutS [Leptospira sp. GIMC2001]WCL50378.1 DNA mismatch repair protein MutS [Leptospira sp. GIMC2001]
MQKNNLKDALDTPVMRQFLEIKAKYPDAILFFRMGDFYEMFMNDAKEAAKILDIALTKRQNEIPMAGIPYHSTESYISRLISAGKKIVICEQTKSDDPKAKIMNREVVRVISPGTVIEENLLGGFNNNFLGIAVITELKIFLGFADVSTSDLLYFSFEPGDMDGLRASLYKFNPKEIVIPLEQKEKWDHLFPEGSLNFHPLITTITNEEIQEHNESKNELNLENKNKQNFEKNYSKFENSNLLNESQLVQDSNPSKFKEYEVLEHILDCYLSFNYRENSFSFKKAEIMSENEYLVLDEESVRNLELVDNDKSKDHTLFAVLNFCRTSVGKRSLKRNILFPTRNMEIIQNRWKAIDAFSSKKNQTKIREELDNTSDLERIMSRFRGNKAYPRDFAGILNTLKTSAKILSILQEMNIDFSYAQLSNSIAGLTGLQEDIDKRIFKGELPVFLGNSAFIQEGFNSDLDRSRKAKNQGKDWILDLEEKQKKETGLGTLKIRFNKILGYYIEISRNQAKSLPESYSKKQTLVGSERFTCPELEEIERTILQADQVIDEIEKQEFDFLVGECLEKEELIRDLSRELGQLDFFLSLTVAKDQYGWKKPEATNNRELLLNECRHPVVEKYLPIGESFVPNSIHLDNRDESIAILTGPNMAGKSTFMRQVALNQILFQIGSYLPIKSAKLPIVDRIFTRIGSGDNLTGGESTFFIEMKETAHILNQMTEESLILFDEVGRGTSTYDGLSLAWAILEYLAERDVRTKTIFATHYHELTELERGNGIFNLYMDTYEKEGEVLFLKKVKRGKVKKSFGIYVAKIAGVPIKITKRAEEILEGLESKKKEIRIRTEEPSLFPGFQGGPDRASLAMDRIRKKLQTMQVDKTTPIEALGILDELQRWSKEQ